MTKKDSIRNAPVFADRLLTLPVHEYVTRQHAERIVRILDEL